MFTVDNANVNVGTILVERVTNYTCVVTAIDRKMNIVHLMYSDGSVQLIECDEELSRDFYVLRFRGEKELISFEKHIVNLRTALSVLEDIVNGRN